MEEIRQQVKRARRRLIAQQFLTVIAWSLFAALSAAVIAAIVPKIWVVPVESDVWMWSWFGGAMGAGFLIAFIWTYVIRRGSLETAIEIDRRFGLKERVSSALALDQRDIETEAGKALLNDAAQRVAVVDVGEQFKVAGNWRTALPFAPALAFFLIALLISPAQPAKSQAKETALASKERIKNANDELKKKIEAQIKKAEEKGLKDAEVMLKELEEKVDKLSGKDSADKKEALLKLNDLKSEMQQQRDKLGADKMRKQFEQLKNMEKGPADKMTSAMKEGDFQKAMKEVKELQKQLASGEMSAEQRKELAKQLDQMKEALQDVQKAHKEAKKELEKKIAQAKAAGDKATAKKLEKELNQMAQQDQNMQQMQKMSDDLGECSQALASGDTKKAADKLGQMSQQLQKLQKEMEELESLDEMLDQIADAKDAMNCKECNGEGCEACQGNKMGQMGNGQGNKMGMQGMGLGPGQGRGDRPEAETDTGEYLSRVGAKPQAGEAIRTGEAAGANVSGKTKEGVKEEIMSSLSADSDPLSNQPLPKSEAKHAKEYFEKLRDKQ